MGDDDLVPDALPPAHTTVLELESARVRCEDCPWFHWAPHMSEQQLGQLGRQHTRNAERTTR